MHQSTESPDELLFQAAQVAHWFHMELPLDLVHSWLMLRFGLHKK